MNSNNSLPVKKIISVIAGIFLSLALLEALLRLAGFIYLTARSVENDLSVRRDGTCRVMCIGESTTAGQYTKFLEAALNRKSKKVKFSVIDKGVPGTNTWALLRDLEGNLSRYRPHIVVAMAGVNDAGWNSVTRESAAFEKIRVIKLFKILCLDIKYVFENKFGKISRDRIHWDRLDPRTPPKGNIRGNIEQELNDGVEYGVIEKELLSLKDKYPEEANPYIWLALLYYMDNEQNRDKGNECLIQAEKYANCDIRACCRIIYAYLWGGENDKAEAVADKYLLKETEGKNKYLVASTFGELYLRQNKIKKAADSFTRAFEARPGAAEHYLERLGEMRWKLGDKSNAEKYFLRALKIFPEDIDLLGVAGLFYLDTGNRTLAQNYFRKYDSSRKNIYYEPPTRANYKGIVGAVKATGAKMVCMEYPTRKIAPLAEMLDNDPKVLFVDNEKIFKDAIGRYGYYAVFNDRFTFTFGHCTDKGNELLADNLADKILERWFSR